MGHRSQPLAHVDLRPASFEVHLVHIRFHQQNSTPVLGKGARNESVVFCPPEVKSFSLIRHDDGYFLVWPAAAPDVHFRFWMFAIAVHDGITQSLAERQFDTELFSRNTMRTLNQQHQTFHQR